MIKPIVRKSLVETVVERIRGVIDQEKLGPGDRLPSEAEFVRQLQVSRPVLRQAVSRLETMGLVTIRRGLGTFVGDRGALSSCAQLIQSAMAISAKDLIKFAQFRGALECGTARQAAELARPEDVQELERLCDQIRFQGGKDYFDAIRVDFQFHRKLADITGNELIQQVMEVLQEFIIAGMVQTTLERVYSKDNYRNHYVIVEAIRTGDPDAAERAMRAHMDHHMEFLRRRLRQNGKNGAKSKMPAVPAAS